jgi:hypothetical protein
MSARTSFKGFFNNLLTMVTLVALLVSAAVASFDAVNCPIPLPFP